MMHDGAPTELDQIMVANEVLKNPRGKGCDSGVF